jgi:hypothetical protein
MKIHKFACYFPIETEALAQRGKKAKAKCCCGRAQKAWLESEKFSVENVCKEKKKVYKMLIYTRHDVIFAMIYSPM